MELETYIRLAKKVYGGKRVSVITNGLEIIFSKITDVIEPICAFKNPEIRTGAIEYPIAIFEGHIESSNNEHVAEVLKSLSQSESNKKLPKIYIYHDSEITLLEKLSKEELDDCILFLEERGLVS